MKSKKVIWIVAIIVILGGAFYIYNQKQENGPKIEEQLKGIDKKKIAFNKEKNESKQFKDLEKLIKEADEYKAGTKKNKKVIKRYDDSIYQARKLLIDKNEKSFEDSKITNIAEATTRDITIKENTLKVLSKRVEIQDLTVYNKKTLKKVKSKISQLKKTYEKKVNTLNQSKEQVKEQESVKPKATSPSMNLSQIQQGNYTSLLGNWEEVAVSTNHQNGEGSTWSAGVGEKLSVKASEIIDGSAMKLQGNTLIDNNGNVALKFKEQNGYLTADSDDQMATILWNVSFYPKGVAMANTGDSAPTSIDNSKDRVVIWTSNNSYQQVFEKNKESASTTKTSMKTSSTDTVKMDTNKIEAGNYSSIKGTWKNKRGHTINVTDNVMKFTDITGFNQAGNIKHLTVNIPEYNLANGKPELAGLYKSGDETKYKKELKATMTDEVLKLKGVVDRSGLNILFLPSGKMGDLLAGSIDKDKIVAVSSQEVLSARVAESDVYYKVN
ncbi:DUF6287 domain-containing protein [Dellaglioa sp. BT-FLS60]